jgi:hypothetical protein
MRTTLFTLLAATALASCATPTGETRVRGIEKYADDARLGEETNRICFASSIDGFSMNDRETVLLHEGRDRYMVEVTAGCTDLDHAEAIGVDSTSNCVTPGDSIVVSQALGGTFTPQRCMITEIRNWDPKAEKAEETDTEENPA